MQTLPAGKGLGIVVIYLEGVCIVTIRLTKTNVLLKLNKFILTWTRIYLKPLCAINYLEPYNT